MGRVYFNYMATEYEKILGLPKIGRFPSSSLTVLGVSLILFLLKCYHFGRLSQLFQSGTTLQMYLFGFMTMVNLVPHPHGIKLGKEITSGSQAVGHGIDRDHKDTPYVHGRPSSLNYLQ